MSLITNILIYIVLIGATYGELQILDLNLAYNLVVGIIIGLAAVKALLIALFYQHLKSEPVHVSALMLFGLVGILIFMYASHISFGGV